MSEEIKQDLLQYIDRGKSWCSQFMEECFMGEERFERAIPRRKIKNFTSAAMKATIKQEQKSLELKGTRDFGRLLYLPSKELILRKFSLILLLFIFSSH